MHYLFCSALHLLVASTSLSQVVTFTAGPADANCSSFKTSNGTALADGNTNIVLTIVLRDSNGNKATSRTVDMAASGGNNIFVTSSGFTDSSGQYTARISSTQVQSETITAHCDGAFTLSQSVQFLVGPPDATTSHLDVDPATQTADNANVALAKLTLLDAQRHPIAGQTPTFTTSGANITISTPSPTDDLGQSTASYRTATAQNVNASASVGTVSLTKPVSFVPGPPATGVSTLAVSPNSISANGVSTASVVATARDAQGNLVPSSNVSMASNGNNIIFGNSNGLTGTDGRFVTTAAASQAQNTTLTATYTSGATASVAMRFTPQVASASKSTITANPNSQVADNSNVITVTLTLNDASGYPIPSVTSTWTASGTSTSVVHSGNTTAAGLATATYKTAVAQNQNAKVVSGGVTLTLPISFVPGPINKAASAFYAIPARQVANDMNTITTFLDLRDAKKNIIAGKPVSFTASGNNTYITATAATDSNGLAQANYQSTMAQNQNAQVTADGTVFLTPIIFTETPTHCSLSVNPNTQPADGNSNLSVTATLTNNANQPVANIRVAFSSSGSAQKFSANGVITNASGQASCTLSSLYAGADIILARAGNITCSVQRGFNARTPYCTGTPTYSTATYTAGEQPWAVLADDFNADGKADIAVSDYGDNTLSIYIGTGTGTFANRVTYGTSAQPIAIAVGDLNVDGKKDLAVANYGENSLGVFIGNGSGTFKSQVTYNTGTNPCGIVIGDLNNDGTQDVAIVNYASSTLSVFIGTGSGTLQNQVVYTTQNSPQSIAIGDFDGDGNLDLTVASDDQTLYVFRGTGMGTFPTSTSYSIGTRGDTITVGDFNADGIQDLAVASYYGGYQFLIGTAGGTFQGGKSYGSGSGFLESIIVGDYNGDGLQDIALVHSNSNYLGISLGDGTGTMGANVTYATSAAPKAVISADFNLDGKQDIAVLNGAYGGPLQVFLANGCQ